jgi:hypothetical protein
MSSSFTCPNCGAPLNFKAGRTDVTCDNCGRLSNLQDLIARMQPVNTQSTNDGSQLLTWLTLGNRAGCFGCLWTIVVLTIGCAIVWCALSFAVPGGISGVLTQVAR